MLVFVRSVQFMAELMRVAAPGGKIILVTWCHRPLAPGEKLTDSEQRLLDQLAALRRQLESEANAR